jgi:8-oxo-dGTP pyrophosphatase MutT (NUDIX family)
MDWDRLRAGLLPIPRAEAAFPEGHRRAAVALALLPAPAGVEVLLMRRAEREGDRWSGQISLPGGHAEPEDSDLAATATRETREEVGLQLADEDLLGALEPVQARARGGPLETSILPAVYLLGEERPALDLGPEATEAFWFPLTRAARGEFDGQVTHGSGTFPCWHFGRHTVWGLTHGILGVVAALLMD